MILEFQHEGREGYQLLNSKYDSLAKTRRFIYIISFNGTSQWPYWVDIISLFMYEGNKILKGCVACSRSLSYLKKQSEVKRMFDGKATSSISYFLFPYFLTASELSGGVNEFLAWLVNYFGENLLPPGVRGFWISSRGQWSSALDHRLKICSYLTIMLEIGSSPSAVVSIVK